MKEGFLFLQFLVAAAVPGQIDSMCRGGNCQFIAVQNGTGRFIDQGGIARNLKAGKYAPAAQHLVPKIEAPVRDLRSPRGWRVVVSVYFDHKEDELYSHIRFFGPDGALGATEKALWWVFDSHIGNLFGGSDEIFAITSEKEHSYNDVSEIWFLPVRGVPVEVFEGHGGLGKFIRRAEGQLPGVVFGRQTYDGVDSATKGFVEEFWRWDAVKKTVNNSPR